MTEATFRQTKFHDITHMGIRVAVGVIFLAHGLPKFEPGFLEFLTNIGIPHEMQIILALAETVPGILLIVGVLTRVGGVVLSLMMLGAIFYVKKADHLTGQGGYEIDLILLASALCMIAAGPGRISIAHVIKKIPRFLH
jgi:putative oxidoreductase